MMLKVARAVRTSEGPRIAVSGASSETENAAAASESLRSGRVTRRATSRDIRALASSRASK